MGISELDASGGNILDSLAWWLHGTFAVEAPSSCAKAKSRYGYGYVAQAWSQIFDTSPEPIVWSMGHDAESDIEDRFVNAGSPMLIITCPTIRPTVAIMGSTSYHAQAEFSLEVRCKVWADVNSREVDIPQTRIQWMDAKDVMQKLLRSNSGWFPIYDMNPGYAARTPLTCTRVGAGRLSQMMQAVDRQDLFSTVFTLRASLQIDEQPAA